MNFRKPNSTPEEIAESQRAWESLRPYIEKIYAEEEERIRNEKTLQGLDQEKVDEINDEILTEMRQSIDDMMNENARKTSTYDKLEQMLSDGAETNFTAEEFLSGSAFVPIDDEPFNIQDAKDTKRMWKDFVSENHDRVREFILNKANEDKKYYDYLDTFDQENPIKSYDNNGNIKIDNSGEVKSDIGWDFRNANELVQKYQDPFSGYNKKLTHDPSVFYYSKNPDKLEPPSGNSWMDNLIKNITPTINENAQKLQNQRDDENIRRFRNQDKMYQGLS